MHKNTVSIIVPVYNTEKYLKRCVDSILAQTYTDIEVLLIDDGSTDNSGKICDEFAMLDDRVKTIHKQNGGVSDARNNGISHASGKRICFVDSDDMISPRYVEVLKELADKSGCPIAQCDCLRFSECSEIPTESFEGLNSYIIDSISVANNMSLSVIVWNKIYDIKLFDNFLFPVGRIHEDLATTYKLIEKSGKICITDAKLYYYYVNPSGITGSKIKINKLDLIKAYLEQYDYFSRDERYKTARFKAANNIVATFAYLSACPEDRYEDYAEFIKELNIMYREVRPRLLGMKLKKAYKVCVFLSPKTTKLLSLFYKIKNRGRR